MQLVSTHAEGVTQSRRKPPRNQLGDLAQRIRDEHQAVVAAVKSGVEHAMAAGDLLLQAKERAPHGEWGNWLTRHCEISDRTARLYMQLAQNREAIAKRQRVADLTLREAAEAIAARKTKTTPAPSKTTVQPITKVEVGPEKRSTYRDLMAVWLNTPGEEQLRFMNAVGLVRRRDVEVIAAPKPPPPKKLAYNIPGDLSIPECLRVTS